MGLTNAVLVTSWQHYLITPVNRDDLSNNMATGKLSKRSPIRVRSKLTVINVSFIFRLVIRRSRHSRAFYRKIIHTSPVNQNRVFTRAMV